MSDATSGNARATPRPSTAPAAAAPAAAATAEQRADMVTPADFATFQQQLRQEVADVIQQLRAELNEAISVRMDMLNGINTALHNVSARPAESNHIGSATSFREIGKAAMKRESSGASCRTCTCGRKRGQIKESRFLPGLLCRCETAEKEEVERNEEAESNGVAEEGDGMVR